MSKLFDIEQFNIIADEENYYFFRALNMSDNQDIDEGTILDENGNYIRIRTDRERYEEDSENEAPKYSKDSKISLEQVYDHVKMHYRKDTNCISLSSNSNVSISYGRGSYKDKYVMIKVPKKEFGEKVINAGQYMLEEIRKRVDEYISSISADDRITEAFTEIDRAKTAEEIKKAIEKRYTSKEIDPNKAGLRKGIYYRAPHSRISSYQALNEEQSLEKNKIIARLTLLERIGGMSPIIPHTANNNLLVQTIGNAFSSLELIHYGDIEQENIIDIPKEIVDIFALLQQVDGEDSQVVNELKKEVIQFINEGRNIEIPESSNLLRNDSIRENITIDEMYELTNGKVEYGMANSIVKNMFYLAKGQLNARALAELLRRITNDNPKYERIIEYIENNGFEIEPQILTRQNKKGYKLSESVNLNLKPNEFELVGQIRGLTDNEQIQILENGGLSNVSNIMTSNFAKVQTQGKIERDKYYAEAIFSLYDWQEIGIEQFTAEEKNNLLQRIQDEHCVDLYKKLEEKGIERRDIPKILLNIITRKNDFEITQQDTEETIKEKRLEQYDRILEENILGLSEELSIERIERFLGYYDVKDTEIQLRPYQQRAVEKTDEIFEKERFASVILPTGAGKSFVVLSQLMEHKDEEILYLAPQNEILEQMKDYIIKYIHGPVNTIGRTKDEIISDIFPNLRFSTYPGLLYEDGEEIINQEYGFIVLDELHRTGARKWGERLNTLIDNQTESTKVLGITATPRRDADGKNMANEIAQKLGYTNTEAVSGKHVAMNMSLTNAIRMGLVVNPKLISCAYTLKTDGSLDRLGEKIDQIEDVQEKNEKLKKYETLRRNLDGVEGIQEILQANVKKGGKYIVFLPIVDEIEDEDGNVIGRKKGKEKLKDYEKQIDEYFKNSNITPNFHSMLGEYGDEGNETRLKEFQNRNTDDTEFMLVMNKANEGLHLDKLDGIIWLRPMDENSRILYLQQLGRVIYSEDPDNPTKDEDRPVVIDLVNNTLKVNWDNEITKQDDIELLTIIVDWAEKHDGTLPDINSNDKEEIGYATVLKEIQSKYKEYLDNDFTDLNEKQMEEVQEILRLGSLINLWERELSKKTEKTGGIHGKGFREKNGEFFELTGLLKDFVELENEVNEINNIRTILKNILEARKWCEEKFEGEPRYKRRLPRTGIRGVKSAKKGEIETKEQVERRLGLALSTFRSSELYKKAILGVKLTEEEQRIYQLYKELENEYDINTQEAHLLEVREWCEEKFKGKPRYERRTPRKDIKGVKAAKKEEQETEEQREIRLGGAYHHFKQTDLYKKAISGVKLTEEEQRIYQLYKELEEEYNVNELEANLLKVKEWCEEKFEGKPIHKRRLPYIINGIRMAKEGEKETEEQRETRLGGAFSHFERTDLYKKVISGVKLTEVEKRIYQLYKELKDEYDINSYEANLLETKEWCEEKFEGEPRYKRRLPRSGIKGVKAAEKGEQETEKQKELRLGRSLVSFRQSDLYKKAILGAELTEEEQKIYELYRQLKNEYYISEAEAILLEVKEWCEEKFKEEPRNKRRLPSPTIKCLVLGNGEQETEEQREMRLGKGLTFYKNRHLYRKIKEGKELTEEEERIYQLYKELEDEYASEAQIKKVYRKIIKCQEIGKATFDSSVEKCDEADVVLGKLVEKTKEGGLVHSE